MPDERDRYRGPRAKSPALGRPVVPQGEFDSEEPSEVRNAPGPIERIDARTRNQSTSIQEVRKELKDDIAGVKKQVGGMQADIRMVQSDIRGINKTQIDIHKTMGDMREDLGAVRDLPAVVSTLATERKALIQDLADERRKAREEDHLTVKAQIDVDRHAKLAEIDETAGKQKARREWVTKGLAIVSTLLAIGLAIMQARGCATKDVKAAEDPAAHVPTKE